MILVIIEAPAVRLRVWTEEQQVTPLMAADTRWFRSP